MPQVSPAFPVLSLVVCQLIELLFGIGFNWLVGWMNERRLVPVSLSVAFGVFVTLLVPTLFFWNYQNDFYKSFLVYLVCFVSSGIPMIFGNVHRETKKSHKVRRLGNKSAMLRDEVVIELNSTIQKIVKKEAEVVDVVHTLHEVIGTLKSL